MHGMIACQKCKTCFDEDTEHACGNAGAREGVENTQFMCSTCDFRATGEFEVLLHAMEVHGSDSYLDNIPPNIELGNEENSSGKQPEEDASEVLDDFEIGPRAEQTSEPVNVQIPEEPENSCKADTILNIFAALQKQTTRQIACSEEVAEKLSKFPCALCNNVEQTRLAALCHLKTARKISAQGQSEDGIQLPDLFVPHQDEEPSVAVTVGSSAATRPWTSTDLEVAGPSQQNLRLSKYLPSTLRSNKLGKKSALRMHCELCGKMESTEFDLRMHREKVQPRLLPKNPRTQ